MKVNANAVTKNSEITVTIHLVGLRLLRFRLFAARLLIYPTFALFAWILGASADIRWKFDKPSEIV